MSWMRSWFNWVVPNLGRSVTWLVGWHRVKDTTSCHWDWMEPVRRSYNAKRWCDVFTLWHLTPSKYIFWLFHALDGQHWEAVLCLVGADFCDDSQSCETPPDHRSVPCQQRVCPWWFRERPLPADAHGVLIAPTDASPAWRPWPSGKVVQVAADSIVQRGSTSWVSSQREIGVEGVADIFADDSAWAWANGGVVGWSQDADVEAGETASEEVRGLTSLGSPTGTCPFHRTCWAATAKTSPVWVLIFSKKVASWAFYTCKTGGFPCKDLRESVICAQIRSARCVAGWCDTSQVDHEQPGGDWPKLSSKRWVKIPDLAYMLWAHWCQIWVCLDMNELCHTPKLSYLDKS